MISAAFQDPEIYRNILDVLQIGVSVLDLHKRIVFWSDGAEHITGYARIEVIGHSCNDNILQHCNQAGCDMCSENCPISLALHDGQPVETLGLIQHKSGYRSQMHLWAIPLRDRRGSIIGIIQTFEGESTVHGPDPNDRAMQEHGWLDGVTGLPNQAMTNSHLREALGTFTELHIPFGIVCVEAQEFGKFRARYGQGAARSMAQVLARTLRNSIWPTDYVGMWHEHQFLAVLGGCSEESLHSVSQRIRRTLATASIKWWGEDLSAPVSIGRTGAQAGDTLESLLRRAGDDLGQNQIGMPAHAGAGPSSTS
jgi:diguanylate cyclase (GGDEF)-like protein/PAS domain S-box-containing protein